MARKSSKTQISEIRRPALQVRRTKAENRIQVQIEKGRQLLELKVRNKADLEEVRVEKRKWSDYNKELLRRIVDTEDLVRDYDPGVGIIAFGAVPLQVEIQHFYSDLKTDIARLESILGRLELIPESPKLVLSVGPRQPYGVEIGDRVFIVHGHDEDAKQSLARCIEKLGLEAIVLHEQPNQGRTIIEKFEDYADVGFAVILLTPDDVGASRKDRDNLKPRARQNVILELGYFIGRLGRQRVCALHRGDLEIPSDLFGVLWVSLDPNDAWQFALAREMKAAGLDVDLNRLI